MTLLEIGAGRNARYIRENYNGDKMEAIKALDGLIIVGNEAERDRWKQENREFCTTPHRCFNALTPLNDTREDLQRLRDHVKSNMQAGFIEVYDIERKKFITYKDITPENYPEIVA